MMFFLVAIAGTSSIFGMFNLHPINIKLLSHQRFFAMQNANFTLLFTNESNYVLYDLYILYKEEQQYLSRIESNISKPINFQTSFSKRGKVTLGTVHIESLFPLIHERKLKNFSLLDPIIVFAEPKGTQLLQSDHLHLTHNGELTDFEGIHKFVQGENIASIHWASLAKSETLMSKKFLFEEKKENLHFSFEQLKGDTEKRLSQLTLWVLECERYGFPFTLTLKNETFDSKKEGIDAILQALALY